MRESDRLAIPIGASARLGNCGILQLVAVDNVATSIAASTSEWLVMIDKELFSGASV